MSEYSAQQKPAGQKDVHGFYAAPGQGVIGEIDGTEYYLGNIKGLDSSTLTALQYVPKCLNWLITATRL